MPAVFSDEKQGVLQDPSENIFHSRSFRRRDNPPVFDYSKENMELIRANHAREDAIRYKKIRALKKDSVFMKLARKQFDQSNATKVKRRGKFRIPAPRMTVTNTTPWSPRSDDSYEDPDEEEKEFHEIDDGDEYVSDDDGDEEFCRDAAQHFGFLGLDE